MSRFLPAPWRSAVRSPAILAELLMLAALCGALPAAAEPWTIERVLETVRVADPALRAAQESGRADRAEAAGRRWAISPRVSLEAQVTRGDDPAMLFGQKLQQGRLTAPDLELSALNQPPAATALLWGLVVEQPIWNAGRELSAFGEAGRRERAASAAEQAAIAGRLLEAVEAYVGAVQAEAAASADSSALAAAESYRVAATGRLRMGQVSPLDSMRASSRAGDARLRWLAARQAADLARDRLSALLHAPVDASSLAPLPEALAAPPATAPPSRAELVSARETSEAMAIESKRAGMRLLPSLNSRFTVTRYRDANGGNWEPRWTATVLLDLPIWDGARRSQDWNAARARSRQAREHVASLERELGLDLAAAQSEAALALERRAVARETGAAAEEALRFAAERYRAGLLPLTDLLATDAEAARARLARVDAEGRAVLAHYRLLRARGELR